MQRFSSCHRDGHPGFRFLERFENWLEQCSQIGMIRQVVQYMVSALVGTLVAL